MKLFLAPIQGMTTAFYRNAFERIFGGIDAYYSPFIATAENKKISTSQLKDILPEHNSLAVKVIPQLLGNNGNDFRLFASVIADMGYKEINWNIGCPFPMVTNKKKGSGILPYNDMIKSFLEIVCHDISYTLTVKMRLGLNNSEEGMRVIEILNQYPLGEIIIHARTGIQMYTGHVDLNSFKTLASACRHNVTYNGDIFSYDDFVRINCQLPDITSFMLGRGALSNPFLASEIKGRTFSSEEKMKMVKQFHDSIFDYYKSILSGEKHLLDKMKEFWSYMSVHTDSDGKLMKSIKKCHTSKNYLQVINKILDSSTGWNETPFR